MPVLKSPGGEPSQQSWDLVLIPRGVYNQRAIREGAGSKRGFPSCGELSRICAQWCAVCIREGPRTNPEGRLRRLKPLRAVILARMGSRKSVGGVFGFTPKRGGNFDYEVLWSPSWDEKTRVRVPAGFLFL